MSGGNAQGGPSVRARVHAALVHFPISAWSVAAALTLTAPVRDSAKLAGIDTAALTIALIWTGLVLAGVAAVAGLVEFSRLPDDDRVLATATRHLLLMAGTSVLFLLLGLAHPATGALALSPGMQAALAALGLCTLIAGGHLGGRLVVLRERHAVK